MDKYTVYLLQYKKGEQNLNRFYAAPGRIFSRNDDNLFNQIEDFANKTKHETLDDLAVAVEEQFLAGHGFVTLTGIKRTLKSYRRVVREIHLICAYVGEIHQVDITD